MKFKGNGAAGPASGKRQIPIEDVTWGMYGEIKAMGPEGSKCTQTGYVVLTPRVFTGGIGMGKPKYKGEPILYFVLESPRINIGMNALPGTMFTVLAPPKDYPLTRKPSDSRRMPVADVRADDIVGIMLPGGRLGRTGPDIHLSEDPKPVGGGYYELNGLFHGIPETHRMHGDEWVDVDGPAVRHLVGKDSTDTPGVGELPPPGKYPSQQWKLLGQVSLHDGSAASRAARYLAAMRRVHGVAADAPHEELMAARDADDRLWDERYTAYWNAYAALMAEEGAQRTAAAEPFPAPAAGEEETATVEEETDTEGEAAATEPAPDAVPSGATILCPGSGCGRQAKVKRDGKIASHYKYGKEKCRLANKPVPAGAKVLRLPDERDATLFDELAEFVGELAGELGDLEPATETQEAGKSAEVRLLEKVAKRTPVDAVQWTGDGRGPAVLARCVANGVYVEATGVDRDRKPITATGYVVEARPLSGGYGGWSRKPIIVVTLSAYPHGVSGPMVQMGEDDRVIAVGAPAGQHPGIGFPWVRTPVEHQILAARSHLGLEVEVYDGPHNELWRVEGCPEKLGGEVASWLFESDRYGDWEGRVDPVFGARHMAAAIHAGRYRAPQSPAVAPSTLVQECVLPRGLSGSECRAEYDRLLLGGHLIDGAGAPLWSDDCRVCEIRRPHQITSGMVCAYEIACPTCDAGPNSPCTWSTGNGKFGGLHDARTKLTRDVIEARALAGDLRVAAPWPGRDAERRKAAAAKATEQTQSAPSRPKLSAEQHIRGTVRLPYDTATMPSGTVVPAHVCCACGGVELNAFALGNNHRCCDSAVPVCELIRPSNPMNEHWTPPAQDGPVNAGPVLDELLADADNPAYGQSGRQTSREHAERYAAGLPLVRHKRQLDIGWTFSCPVPTCLRLFDGHDTIREAREAWFEHAAKHDGFTATWPDDVLPVEPEAEEKQTKRPRATKSKRKGPLPAVIEVFEPVGNDWWDDSALAWERSGILYREPLDTPDGAGQYVAFLSMPQGYAKAHEFKALLASVGGINDDDMIVHVLTEDQVEADRKRRDVADAQANARALRAVRQLDDVPPRPAGQVPTIVKVDEPPTGDPWWDEHLARWDAARIVKRQNYGPGNKWPNGVHYAIKLITPWDEPQAKQWAADLVALGGLLPDRVQVYRAAASPEPAPGNVEAASAEPAVVEPELLTLFDLDAIGAAVDEAFFAAR